MDGTERRRGVISDSRMRRRVESSGSLGGGRRVTALRHALNHRYGGHRRASMRRAVRFDQRPLAATVMPMSAIYGT